MATAIVDTKGYLFNLVIYTREASRFRYFYQRVEELIETFPCRAIFVCGDQQEFQETNHNSLTLQVPSYCLQKVPYLVLPCLIPDLPVYLIWGDDPSKTRSMEEKITLKSLQRIATRLIFDPETAEDLQKFSQEMVKKYNTLDAELMDLCWVKIGGWRDVIYQAFSSTAQQMQLAKCKRFTIKYNHLENSSTHHSAVQAIYLQGWIAAQLNWTFSSINSETDSLIYTCEGSSIEVKLLAEHKESFGGGQIFEVELNDGMSTTLTLSEKQSKVMVYFSNARLCALPFSLPIPNLEKGANLVRELFYYLPSSHYRNMLTKISLINWSKF